MCFENYLAEAKESLLAQYPKQAQFTQAAFSSVFDFVGSDFAGISEHKVFRALLDILTELVEEAFACDVPKSYLQAFFKALHCETAVDSVAVNMPARKEDVKFVLYALKQNVVHIPAASEKEYRKDVLIDIIEKMY